MTESDVLKTPEVGSARQRRILVIDDDTDLVRIVRYMLRDAGYSVAYAYSGAEGIQKAKAERPDLVLTDLVMPKVSGVQVIDALHNDPETHGIPILVVTAYGCDALGQAAHRAGCAGHIPKPFTAEQLLRYVRRYLDPRSGEAPEAPPAAPPEAGRLRLRA